MATKQLPPFAPEEQAIIDSAMEKLFLTWLIPCRIATRDTGMIVSDEDETAPHGRQIVICVIFPDGSGTFYKYLTPDRVLDEEFGKYMVSTVLETFNAYNNRG